MQKHFRNLWIVWGTLALIVFLYPINSLPLRVGLLGLSLAAFASFIWRFRKQKWLFRGSVALVVLVVAFLICPGRKTDPQSLRNAYLHSLRTYEGSRFVWGGENKFGVDCSGLVRAGLIKASAEEGFRTLNPELVRFSLSLWWHDCSAKSLGEEFRNQTRHVLDAKSIKMLQETSILPGDLAVTANGIHVLAFLGNGQWIEADPAFGKVIIAGIATKGNGWFDLPVRIMRWTELEAK